MKNPPNFVIWVILARYNGEHDFIPWGTVEEGPAENIGGFKAYRKRSLADRECKRLRKYIGKGNCYVQQYGPYR